MRFARFFRWTSGRSESVKPWVFSHTRGPFGGNRAPEVNVAGNFLGSEKGRCCQRHFLCGASRPFPYSFSLRVRLSIGPTERIRPSVWRGPKPFCGHRKRGTERVKKKNVSSAAIFQKRGKIEPPSMVDGLRGD